METAELVPVSKWVWNLYKAVYTRDQAGKHIICEKWFVETATHIEYQVEEYCPRTGECWWTWTRVKENVPAREPIGNLYGIPLFSSTPVDPKEYGL